MKKQLTTFLFITGSALIITGCVTQPATPPQMTQIQCTIPKIEVIADSVNKSTQSKGGLDITVVPALYKTVRADKTTITQIEPPAAVIIFTSQEVRNTHTYVQRVTTPQLKSNPNRVVFTVKIHNQLNRVFHGQGAVVQINVDGNLIPFNNTDYKEFSGGIVPPLNDADLIIKGPPLDTLKDKGTISVFLYDVVTATDVAGNTTEKQNYTWDFSYTTQTVTDSGERKVVEKWMSPMEYSQIMAQQQIQQMQIQNQGNTLQ